MPIIHSKNRNVSSRRLSGFAEVLITRHVAAMPVEGLLVLINPQSSRFEGLRCHKSLNPIAHL